MHHDVVTNKFICSVESSVQPEYRHPASLPVNSGVSQFASPMAIQPSMDGTGQLVPVYSMFRVADPFFFRPFSSLISSFLSSLLTPPVTVTRYSVAGSSWLCFNHCSNNSLFCIEVHRPFSPKRLPELRLLLRLHSL